MEQVNVTEFRRNLPEYLAKAKRGQRVRVTSKGKVVAELAPPTASSEKVEAARARLRGSLLKYDNPTEPAIRSDGWDANR